jgi:SAM-dependent methyltransferase
VAACAVPCHGRGVPQDYFDEPVAARYDASEADMFGPEVLGPTVDFLAGLADDRPVLELGSGTGRVALPLSARGLAVHGVELSEAMTARLHAKPGGDAVEVTTGDFATTRVAGRLGEFGLAYLVFNTIDNLLTQDAQVACFQNVADHLGPGGRFVVEVLVPAVRLLPPGTTRHVFHRDEDHVGIDEYDLATQAMWSHHLTRRGDRFEQRSIPFRYAWPAELDLMARLAGMTLRERWADFSRAPFTGESTAHVSVWSKA